MHRSGSGFDIQSLTFRLGSFRLWSLFYPDQYPSATVLDWASRGYYRKEQLIYCSECFFNCPMTSELATVHFASMPGCEIAKKHKLSDILVPISEMEPAPVTRNAHYIGTSSPAAAQESGTSPLAANSSTQIDGEDLLSFASLGARVESFDRFRVPNGNIHAAYGLYMESEYSMKCFHCGVDNFSPGCLDGARGWQDALEIHSYQQPSCPYVCGQATSF